MNWKGMSDEMETDRNLVRESDVKNIEIGGRHKWIDFAGKTWREMIDEDGKRRYNESN